MFGLDARSLALMRVLYAVVVLFDLFDRARYIVAAYTDFGFLPRGVAMGFYNNSWVWSLHFLSGSWQLQTLLLGLAAVFACMLLTGYKTKLATIVSWVLLISLQTRNPLILQGGDVVMRLGLFWAMFLPWGRYYSVDSAMRLPKKETQTQYFSGASVAYILQIAFIYWFAFLFKSGPEWTNQGTAIYYALSIGQFATPLGQFVLSLRPLLSTITFSVLALEGLGPFLFFFPVFTQWARLLGVLAFIGFHAGLAATMHLGPFPFVMIASLVGLLPAIWWDWLQKLFTSGARPIAIYYDNECGFCKNTVRCIQTFLLLPAEYFKAASQNPDMVLEMVQINSWIIVDSRGRHNIKFNGFVAMVQSSPFWLLAPVLRFAPVHYVGTRVYEYVARHNQKKCLPPNSVYYQPPFRWAAPKTFFFNLAAIMLIGYILFWNIMEFAPTAYTMPQPAQSVAWLLRLDQKWNMFSPAPPKESGWYVIPGKLRNGQTVDVFKEGESVSYQKPRSVAATYDGERWRKYLMNLWLAVNADYRLYYGQYLCRTWNTSHEYDEQLITFEIIFMRQQILLNYQPSDAEPVVTWNHRCF